MSGRNVPIPSRRMLCLEKHEKHVNFANICVVWAPIDQDTSHNELSDRKQQIFIFIAGVDLQVQVAMDRASQPCSDSQRVKEACVRREIRTLVDGHLVPWSLTC